MQRKLLNKLIAHLEKPVHTILIGARQVGKTTLLKQIRTHLEKENKQVSYISFEDPSSLQSINKHPDNLFRMVPRPGSGKNRKTIYVLVDEIQYAADPSNFLKFIFDKYAPKVKLIVTGSSPFYMDKKFRDSLAGRKKIFHLYPLDFEEFLLFRKQDALLKEFKHIQEQASYLSSQKAVFDNFLSEYLTYGSYPAVVLAEDHAEKVELLKELKSSFLKKDILESDVENEDKFYALVNLLADQTGNLINRHELANTLRITDRTLERYLFVLQKCFHITLIKPYFSNIRKELTRMPKVYFNDCGLRNAFINNFQDAESRHDKGALLENFAFQHLRLKHDPDRLYFWRTADKQEVDFIIPETKNKGQAFEIKWDENSFNPGKYKKFIENYPHYKLQARCFNVEEPSHWILKI